MLVLAVTAVTWAVIPPACNIPVGLMILTISPTAILPVLVIPTTQVVWLIVLVIGRDANVGGLEGSMNVNPFAVPCVGYSAAAPAALAACPVCKKLPGAIVLNHSLETCGKAA